MKQLVSAVARKLPRLASWVRKIYYYWLPEIEVNLVEQLAVHLQKTDHENFYLIQIGAHDGSYDDPIVKIRNQYPHWEGILLEPQPAVYQKLSANLKYANRFKLLNMALSDHDGEQALYEISFSQKDWATGLASFQRESIERSIHKGFVARMAQENGDALPATIQDYIAEKMVKTISFSSLVKSFERKPDCIIIDTEGYDFTVINKLLDHSVTPNIWWFEYSYMSIGELETIIKRLKALGYTVKRSQWDIFAFLT